MTEEEILGAIRSGSRAADGAVRALYESIAKPMLRFFVHCGGVSGDEAEDILQETIVKIVRSAGSYAGEGTAKAWVWQIARNCLTDFLRKQSRESTHLVSLDEDQWRVVEESTSRAEDIGPSRSAEECVSHGVEVFAAQMPERAFALTLYMDGHSMEQIGQQIGRTAAAAKEYLSQCRQKLKPFIVHCRELLNA